MLKIEIGHPFHIDTEHQGAHDQKYKNNESKAIEYFQCGKKQDGAGEQAVFKNAPKPYQPFALLIQYQPFPYRKCGDQKGDDEAKVDLIKDIEKIGVPSVFVFLEHTEQQARKQGGHRGNEPRDKHFPQQIEDIEHVLPADLYPVKEVIDKNESDQ